MTSLGCFCVFCGHSRFEWLVNRGPQRGTLVYYVFDLLMLDGKDLRQIPLLKRKQRLAKLLVVHPRLLEVEHIANEGLSMFAGRRSPWDWKGSWPRTPKAPTSRRACSDLHWQKIKNRSYKRREKVEFRQSR